MSKSDTPGLFFLSACLFSLRFALRFFRTVSRKFRSAPVTTAKSPIVWRQGAVTNHWQNLVCIALPSTMEDKIVCQLHFHCQSRVWKAITFIRETYAWFEINSYCQANGGDFFFPHRFDSLRHGVRRHTYQEISHHIFRKFPVLYPVPLSPPSSILIITSELSSFQQSPKSNFRYIWSQ